MAMGQGQLELMWAHRDKVAIVRESIMWRGRNRYSDMVRPFHLYICLFVLFCSLRSLRNGLLDIGRMSIDFARWEQKKKRIHTLGDRSTWPANGRNPLLSHISTCVFVETCKAFSALSVSTRTRRKQFQA